MFSKAKCARKPVHFFGTLLIALMLLTACGGDQNLSVTENAEVPIPEGYKFSDASSYGEIYGFRTVYCEHIDSGRIYVCTDGTIGDEIIIPGGYTFAGVSEYGRTAGFKTYYCTHKITGKTYECKPT